MTRIDQLAPDHWETTGRRKRDRNYVLPMQDLTEPKALGEGISRTKAPGAKLFAMELRFKGSRPMRTTIRAISWSQAEQFARNRHPDCHHIERLQTVPAALLS